MKKKDIVQVRRDGVSRSDGRPVNMSPATIARVPAPYVTFNSGRHASGQALARPGNLRAGQGPHSSGRTPGTGYNPKTLSTKAMTPREPVRATGANALPDAQRQIMQPPQPFANPHGTVNVPAPPNQNFKSVQTHSRPAKNLHGGSSQAAYNITHVGCANTGKTNFEAVGYTQADIQKARGTRERDSIRGVRNNERKNGMPGTRQGS
jgi:hypothetical protein